MRVKLYAAFLYFYYAEWDETLVMTSRDIADFLDIDLRLVRYYMVKFVHERRIACIKYDHRSYYVHRWIAEPFSVLDGVKIINS